MGQKGSGIERFLAPSVSKIEEEVGSIHAEIDRVNEKMKETDNRITRLEDIYKHLAAKMDKSGEGLADESKVLINNITEMEKQDRVDIDDLKRIVDVAQRRLVILEAKMKELGK